jgi:TolB-like protein/DNA-binding winged helix-turn-helix (wHTH) protein/Tfp pilus assembly protein PilF
MQVFEFGPYRLDTTQKLLLYRGAIVPLTPKAIEILTLLVERSGQVVTKEEIFRRVWPNTAVVEGNLTQTIFLLRKALGESGGGTDCIETIPKLGYRFVTAVQNPDAAAQANLLTDSLAVSLESGTFPGPALRKARSLAAAIAIALAATGLGYWRWTVRQPMDKALAAHRIRSIAVLPLANLSGDPAQEYFADGMTDELITMLTELRSLQVTSRTSVMRYRDSSEPLPRIAGELGVEAIVEGAVSRSGNRVRITAQLVDASTDRHLWAASYERPLSDTLSIQADIAREIARQIQLQLTPPEDARLRPRRTLDPAAQQEYLLGLYHWNRRSPADLREALEHFRKAVAIDPQYAEAFAGLADCYLVLPIYNSVSARDTMSRAIAAAQEALRLDGSLAEAHASLAYALEYDWDFSGAEREYLRAIALKPGYATAHQWYAEFLRFMNRQDEAIAQSEIAVKLDPLSPVISGEAGLAFYYRGDYAEALRRIRQAIETDPGFAPSYGNLGWVLEQTGDYSGALAAFERAETHGLEDSPWILAGIGYAYARSGDLRKARRCLNELESLARHSDEPTAQVGLLLTALGNRKEALRWYQRAFQQHDWWLLVIRVDPKLAPLQDDRNFQRLIAEIGLPPYPETQVKPGTDPAKDPE